MPEIQFDMHVDAVQPVTSGENEDPDEPDEPEAPAPDEPDEPAPGGPRPGRAGRTGTGRTRRTGRTGRAGDRPGDGYLERRGRDVVVPVGRGTRHGRRPHREHVAAVTVATDLN